MTRAIVVGSGPNGLAAAVTLAVAGLEVTVLEAADQPGGGTRSVEATVPGVLHDECSGFHPLATDTAFSRSVDLASVGLEWAWPEIQYAHPLDGGRGAVVRRSVAETAQELGSDGPSYQRLFGALTDRFDTIATEFLQPVLHVPRHPLHLARFGAYAGMPAALLARRWSGEEARALWAGVAAHAFRPLGNLASSAIGIALGTAAHRFGWPVAVGGSGSISAAMIALLEKHGGRVETGVRVSSLAECSADVVLLDTSPAAAARIAGDRLPGRVRRAYSRYRHGPGAFQVAFAVEGGIPWATSRRGSPALSTWAARWPRSPPPRPTSGAGGCRSGPTCCSASSTSPTPAGPPAPSTRSTPTPTCRRDTPEMRPRPSSTRSHGSPPGSASGSWG